MITLGADLGGTNVRCAAVDVHGRVLAEQRFATPEGAEAICDLLAEMARALGSSHAASALGVGVAAMVSLDGVVHYAPNVVGFDDTPLRAMMAARTSLPVVVDNDANVAALGELVHGAAQGRRHALVITLGTGIGGGIVLDGRVLRGAHGFAAEVGHFQTDPAGPRCACGELGHWEALASGNALGRMGRDAVAEGRAPTLVERAGGDAGKIDGVVVGDAALAGDADALRILDAYADEVAIGLAGLANVFDPECIVVSGGLVALGELLLDRVAASFAYRVESAARRPAIPIVPAALGEQSGVIGAAALARELVES